MAKRVRNSPRSRRAIAFRPQSKRLESFSTEWNIHSNLGSSRYGDRAVNKDSEIDAAFEVKPTSRLSC